MSQIMQNQFRMEQYISENLTKISQKDFESKYGKEVTLIADTRNGHISKFQNESTGQKYSVKFLKFDSKLSMEALFTEILANQCIFELLSQKAQKSLLPRFELIRDFYTLDTGGLIMFPRNYFHQSLQGLLDRHVKVPYPQLSQQRRSSIDRLLLRLAESVRVLHRRDIIHRDLNPSNIMLAEGRPVITDFGVAHTDSQVFRGLVGSPCFMDPYVRAFESGGRESDVYSLGVTFMMLLNGSEYQHGTFEPKVSEWFFESPRSQPMDQSFFRLPEKFVNLKSMMDPVPGNRPDMDAVIALLKADLGMAEKVDNVQESPRVAGGLQLGEGLEVKSRADPVANQVSDEDLDSAEETALRSILVDEMKKQIGRDFPIYKKRAILGVVALQKNEISVIARFQFI